MKITVIAASLFLLSMPVYAQSHTGGGSTRQLNATNGGGGGFGGFGGSGGFSGVSFSMSNATRTVQHTSYVYAQGSGGTFVPTRFVSFDTAVKLGKQAMAYKPKSIVEVAAECRAAEKRLKASNATKE